MGIIVGKGLRVFYIRLYVWKDIAEYVNRSTRFQSCCTGSWCPAPRRKPFLRPLEPRANKLDSCDVYTVKKKFISPGKTEMRTKERPRVGEEKINRATVLRRGWMSKVLERLHYDYLLRVIGPSDGSKPTTPKEVTQGDLGANNYEFSLFLDSTIHVQVSMCANIHTYLIIHREFPKKYAKVCTHSCLSFVIIYPPCFALIRHTAVNSSSVYIHFYVVINQSRLATCLLKRKIVDASHFWSSTKFTKFQKLFFASTLT